eukprot:gene11578-12771_t
MPGYKDGQIKSFESYRKSKGTQWKERVTKKKDDKGKGQDVIITFGLLEWSDQALSLKPKRGQRLALRVNTKDPYRTILDKAEKKWKVYNCDSYSETEYILTYGNGQCAQFMPGTFQFFDLKKYKEEVGKEFRHLVFYLCTLKDHLLAENKGLDLEDESEPPLKQIKECGELDFAAFDGDSFTESFLNDLQPQQPTLMDTMNHISEETSTESISGTTLATLEKPERTKTSTSLSLKEKLSNIGKAFQEINSEPEAVSVRRRKLWQDTAQKLGRLYANCICPIVVSFIGEAGVDAGGPKREFFSLLFDDCKKHLFATGDGSSFTLLHDLEKVRKKEFQLLGQLLKPFRI